LAAEPREIFVAPTGSDKNPGTFAAPFQTVAKALGVVRAEAPTAKGQMIVTLRGGTHVLTQPIVIDAACSGSEGKPLLIRANAKEEVVISGGRRITGWSLHDKEKSIWKAATPGLQTRQLYINGQCAQRAHARGLNLPAWNFSRGPQGFTFIPRPGHDLTAFRNQQDIELVLMGSNWTQHRVPVQAIEPGLIRCQDAAYQRICLHFQAAEGLLDIENAYELLDACGEWYLDRPAGVVYYMPRAGEDLNTAEVIAPVLETLVDIKGAIDAKVKQVRFGIRSHQVDDFARQQVEIDEAAFDLAPLDQGAHSIDYFAGAAVVLADVRQDGAHLIEVWRRVLEEPLRGLGVAQDSAQWLAQFMRQRGCNLAHRGDSGNVS
jgi:hypothetical protein